MAESLDGAGDHPRHVVVLHDVGLDGDGAAARRLDGAHRRDVVVGAEPRAGNRRAFLGEAQRRGAADARARARDDGRLAPQPHSGLM